ncbi:acyltransferase [Nocardia terpenica]|uniref:phthiocerol/phthiodiolone dimycocerosyl transferase family protein n=1 Tax=Nocardia terpenica TaxID=455432 RepID=UPI001893DC6B|nr:acyltransferase [Nocardia terpenica]MBF6063733.1 acyltransferase [Nocardia terpenica]MBF6107109.1 acyltransferase [Nocardia terpenica]MBF6114282.1 acyltransferase [Nocardia terpenica]MBF6121631.1 acyltransferase [Nocardia terpenica]MBF6154046.1 acyltransferase [Nocardia terpenica]
MTEVGFRRPLAPTEKSFAQNDAFSGYVMRTVGRIDRDALQAAYSAVCQAFPVLAATLQTSDGETYLVESADTPEPRFHEGDPDEPLTGAAMDSSRALSALNVVGNGDESSVALMGNHSISDGSFFLEVLTSLWSAYSAALAGTTVDLPRRPFPKSLEELLAERGIERRSAAAPSEAPRSPAPEPERVEVVQRSAQFRLTEAETTALVDLGHREHVTINGLLSGAILLAEAEVSGRPLAEFQYIFPVNIRHRFTPPVGPTEGTIVLGYIGFEVPEIAEPDAVTIGRAVGDQLKARMSDDSLLTSFLDLAEYRSAGARAQNAEAAQDSGAPAQQRGPAIISLTNWGRIPRLQLPDDLRMTNFHSARRTKAPVGHARPTNVSRYTASTFNGRLGIEHHSPSPEEKRDSQRRLDALSEVLRRLIKH